MNKQYNKSLENH